MRHYDFIPCADAAYYTFFDNLTLYVINNRST
jgi:hypothetical protein